MKKGFAGRHKPSHSSRPLFFHFSFSIFNYQEDSMSTTSTRRHAQTAAVHAGERIKRTGFRTTSTPIYNTATFLYDTAADLDGAFEADPSFVYARHGNPTINALETALATLEGGPAGTGAPTPAPRAAGPPPAPPATA